MINLINKLLEVFNLSIIRTRKSSLKRNSRHKIFCIGFNKTGTTTLEKVLIDLGFNGPDQQYQERLLSNDVDNGQFQNLENFIQDYDFFQDRPFSQNNTYLACDLLFPGSKFILTIRDEDSWFNSIYNYHKKIFGFNDRSEIDENFFKGKKLYLDKDYTWKNKKKFVLKIDENKSYEDWSLLYDEKHYKEIYRNRNNEIIKYFHARPNDLLIIDLTKESDTKKIVNFLGLNSDQIKQMPHKNKTKNN